MEQRIDVMRERLMRRTRAVSSRLEVAGRVVEAGGYLLEDAISSAPRVLACSWNERRKCAGKGR